MEVVCQSDCTAHTFAVFTAYLQRQETMHLLVLRAMYAQCLQISSNTYASALTHNNTHPTKAPKTALSHMYCCHAREASCLRHFCSFAPCASSMASRKVVLIGVTSIATVACVGALALKKSASRRFEDIFNFRYGAEPKCYDRIQFKADFNRLISRPNPIGIVFVCGRLNGGKTTTIKSALTDRKHIAYINWREQTISNPDDLNRSLKDAFHIAYFKDYWASWKWSRWMSFFLPNIDFTNKCTDLEDTMKEIEVILKYSAQNYHGIANRPVIFVDEIGTIQGLLRTGQVDVARRFVKWLVRLSKDEMLCDIVFASNNGYMLELLNLADPQYCRSIVIPDFTEGDVNIVLQQRSHLSEDNHFAKSIVTEVGGHAGHVMDITDQRTVLEMKQSLQALKAGEMKCLEAAIANASKSCKGWFRDSVEGCYELAQLKRTLELFIAHPSSDPEISLDTVVREAQVGKDIIRELVSECYLFLDPHTETLKARNKLFLDVAKEKWDREYQVKALLAEQIFWEKLANDEEVAVEHRKTASLKAGEVKKRLHTEERLKVQDVLLERDEHAEKAVRVEEAQTYRQKAVRKVAEMKKKLLDQSE